jgi:hypothetical protein
VLTKRTFFLGLFSCFLPALSPLLHCSHLQDLFVQGTTRHCREMAELAMYAVQKEKHTVFDGVRLAKRAWIRKGKLKKKDAAVVAGVTEDGLSNEDAEEILRRMAYVKKGFASYMSHYITARWLGNAQKVGLKNSVTNKPIVTFTDLLQELESNPRMESFLNWYNICYKDTDVKDTVRDCAEGSIMREIGLKYTDDTMTGGCIGELILETQLKLMEQINNRSKAKQRLHLVRSRPTNAGKEEDGGMRTSDRRKIGDFFIVRSDGKGKAVSWKSFNVSCRVVCIFLLSCTNICYVAL